MSKKPKVRMYSRKGINVPKKNKEELSITTMFDLFLIEKSIEGLSERTENNNELNIILCNDFIELFPFLAKHKKLNSFVINEYGTFGRSLSRYLNTSENVEIIAKKLLKVMASTSKSLISKIDLYTLSTYIETYKQIESVIKWTENRNQSKELIDKMKNILATMNEYQEINEMINDQNIYLEMLLEEK